MPSSGSLLSLAAAASTANAAFQGFNYGNKFTTGALKVQSDYEAEFKTAAGLEGTDGAFNSARLYTMIQDDSGTEPISAIPAAISTKTSLLFGLWASAGEEAFGKEIQALQKTIDQYCGQLDDLVAGISVGSEDLYRNSPTGMKNNENPGADPDTLVNYIDRVRDTIKGSCLSDVPIGHVDTWTAYANGSNKALIEACDWLGTDAYAYFEDTKDNSIENGASLFQDAIGEVKAAAGGREIWITETGWPVSGKDFGQAVASPENARQFWKDVGCPMFGSTNVWWYTLQDAAPDTPNPSFGVIGNELTKKPIYDLTCDGSDGPKPDPQPSKSSTKSEEPETTKSEHPVPDPEPSASKPHTELPGTSPSHAPIPSADPTPSHELPTTHKPVPIPTVSHGNSTMPTPSHTVNLPTTPGGPGSPGETTPGGGQPGEQPTGSDGGSAPSQPPAAASSQLNSFGAAVVAVVIAVGLL